MHYIYNSSFIKNQKQYNMSKKLTTEEFIRRSKEIHHKGDDYSKVHYVNNHTKVCIICPIHGEYWQRPADHLSGKRCLKCSGNHQYTTEEYIEKVSKIHNYKYIYDKTKYINSHTKIIVTCPIHGDFEILATNHLCGDGCPLCSQRPRYTTETWKIKARENHGDKYDYNKVNYKDSQTKICIICHKKDEFGIEHGEFWQEPVSHLMGCGCPKCAQKYTYTTEEFIERANIKHNYKYIYTDINYIDNTTKICVICPEHGKFWQTPLSHLKGNGCPKCAGNVLKTREEFIDDANKVHNFFFKYDKVVYLNTNTKVVITCPIHGDFEQLPSAHLKGQGCPHCYAEHKNLTETKLKRELESRNINFEYQKRFDWLGLQSLDFYFPEYNSAIEYQGRQHFSTESYFYEFKRDEILNLDLRKLKLCNENGVKLYHLTNEIKYIPEDWQHYKLYTNLDEILQEMHHS